MYNISKVKKIGDQTKENNKRLINTQLIIITVWLVISRYKMDIHIDLLENIVNMRCDLYMH